MILQFPHWPDMYRILDCVPIGAAAIKYGRTPRFDHVRKVWLLDTRKAQRRTNAEVVRLVHLHRFDSPGSDGWCGCGKLRGTSW